MILGGKLKLNFSQFFINFNSIFSFAKNSPPKSLERYILYFFESIFENKKTKKKKKKRRERKEKRKKKGRKKEGKKEKRKESVFV